MSGKLVLARMDNSLAVAYANYGAGRSPELAMLARDAKELEASHIAGRRNTVADALFRFTV